MFVYRKMNVIQKIVIPRTNVTMGYINTELEELGREEFTRLKKVKEKKRRDRELKEQSAPPVVTDIPELAESIHSEEIISICDNNQSDNLKSVLNNVIIYSKDLLLSGIENIDIDQFLKTCEETRLKIDELFKVDEQILDTIDEDLYQKLANLKNHLEIIIHIITEEFQPEILLSRSVENFVCVSQDIKQTLDIYLRAISTRQEHGNKNELEELKDIIIDVKKITKEYKNKGLLSQDVDGFIKSCELMNSKLQKRLKIENSIPCTELDKPFKCVDSSKTVDDIFEYKLEHVKCHLHEVIEIIKNIKPDKKLPFHVESFSQMCQDVDKKLNIYREGKFATLDSKNNRLIKLRDLITKVTQITRNYQKSGLLSANINNFLDICDDMKLKIDGLTPSLPTSSKKNEITDTNKKISGPLSDKRDESKSYTDMQNLMQHIDNTVSLGIEAKAEGIVGESVENFIKAIEVIKDKIESEKAIEVIKDKIESENQQESTVLLDLKLNVREVVNMIKKLKDDGVITVSIEDFIKLCEETEHKMQSNQINAPSTSQQEPSLECEESCINKRDSKPNMLQEKLPHHVFDENPICDTCSNTVDLKKPSNESLTYSNSVSEQQETKSSSSCNLCKLVAQQKQKKDKAIKTRFGVKNSTSPESDSMIETISACELCKLNAKEREKELQLASEKESRDSSERGSRTSLGNTSKASDNQVTGGGVKENFGYYETQRHKKVKITTRQDKDGRVWEEKETITINKVKRDPTKTSLLSDDNDSEENLDKENVKHINLCILSGCDITNFQRNLKSTRSNLVIKIPLDIEPRLRQCVSLNSISYF